MKKAAPKAAAGLPAGATAVAEEAVQEITPDVTVVAPPVEAVESAQPEVEEAEGKAVAEAEQQAIEEAERAAAAEAEKKATEEAERSAALEAEAEKKATEESERRAALEAERKAAEEAERSAALEAAQKAEEEPKAPKKAEKKAGKEAKAEPKETKPAGKPSVPGPAPRLREKYFKTVVPALMKDFSYANSMKAPKLVKIVLNVGMGEAINDVKTLDRAVEEIGRITGQRPVVTRAKQSIATYKLRTGMPIGCMVTLRRGRMFEFLDRLISAALPRIRDFRGISAKSFDGRGNYSMGIKEQVIFPEIDIDKIGSIHGLDVAIVTSAATDEEGRALLTHLGMPFRK